MFQKLKETFIKFTFYTKRSISPFFHDESYRQIRRGFFWLIILSLQILFGVKILEILIPRTQTYFFQRQQRLTLEKSIEQTKNDTAQIRNSPQTVERILSSLPGTKGNYNLLDSLNSAAANSQISLLGINFLPTQKSKISGLLEQRLEVKLQGKFENVFNFLEALKNNPRPVFTENLNLSIQDNKLAGGYVRVDTTLKTYLLESN